MAIIFRSSLTEAIIDRSEILIVDKLEEICGYNSTYLQKSLIHIHLSVQKRNFPQSKIHSQQPFDDKLLVILFILRELL